MGHGSVRGEGRALGENNTLSEGSEMRFTGIA